MAAHEAFLGVILSPPNAFFSRGLVSSSTFPKIEQTYFVPKPMNDCE